MYFLLGAYGRGWKWDDCVFDMGMRMCDLAHQNFVIQCKNVDDILWAHREGKIALIPSFEACTMIENELDRLDILFGLGVRMMGIVYSEANALGSGLSEKGDGGLTKFGHQAVKRLNDLGMAIDVSHCGDKTSMDVIEASSDPIFITHAGARGVWDSRRMKPDEVIIACAEKGGMIGIEAAPHTTFSNSRSEHDIDSCFDHFKYCVDLVGIDHVGFGPDTMYGDHSGLHDVLSQGLSMAAFIKRGESTLQHVDYVRGMENPTECSNNIVRYLVKADYSDEDIGKVIGGNALRILREVWPS
jgi:membrane dipeptidase